MVLQSFTNGCFAADGGGQKVGGPILTTHRGVNISCVQKMELFMADTTENAMEKLLTTGQVARILNCSDEHVRRLIDSKKLRAANIGLKSRSKWRIPESDLAVFIALATGDKPTKSTPRRKKSDIPNYY